MASYRYYCLFYRISYDRSHCPSAWYAFQRSEASDSDSCCRSPFCAATSSGKKWKGGKILMLLLENVQKTFNAGTVNEKKALTGVDLNMNSKDFVTVIGGNGAGKSTMLNMIAGVYSIDKGKVVLNGRDLTREPEYKRAKYISRVFQDPMMGTAANMEIQENLALAYRRGKKRGLAWGITKDEKELFYEKLKVLGLGLEERMTSKVGLLSGGQRQALTLLMASLIRPERLLLN